MLIQTPTYWYQDPITVATWVIAVATVLYFITTAGLYLLTKHMFEATHRPLVGTTEIKMGDTGEPTNQIDIRIIFRNFGTVPAHDLRSEVLIFADGTLIPNAVREEEPVLTAMPTVANRAHATIHDASEYRQVHSANSLTIVFRCSYKGAQRKRYTSETKWKYHRQQNRFHIIQGKAD